MDGVDEEGMGDDGCGYAAYIMLLYHLVFTNPFLSFLHQPSPPKYTADTKVTLRGTQRNIFLMS